MDAYARILKRSALALLLTILFTTFTFNLHDWTKGFVSEFIVYGQTGTTGTTTTGVTDNRSTTHVFAQVADGGFSDGSFYRSTLIVQSDSTSTISCTATLVGLTISGFGDGTSRSFSLAAGGIAIIDTPGTQSIQTGYMNLSCSSAVTAQLLYAFRSAAGLVLSEATVFSSPATTVAQLVADHRGGSQLGIAIANPGTSAKNLLIVANDTSGTEVGRGTATVNARSQRAAFLSSFVTVPSNFLGTVRISESGTSTGEFYAIGLKFTGTAFTTIPVTSRTTSSTGGGGTTGGGSVTISGTVRDGTNGNPLSGATVRISGTSTSTTTNSSGQYTLLATGSSVTLEITATGFVTTTIAVTLTGSTTLVQNVSLSTAVASGEYRFTLNWTKDSSNRPNDLDFHLLVPTSTGCTEVYYASTGSITSSPFAQLEVDNINVVGDPPTETIRISRLTAGTYRLFVHDYAGELSNGLETSRATVQVFGSAGLITTLSVPTGSGRYWTVLSINGSTGAITPVQTRGTTAPTGCN